MLISVEEAERRVLAQCSTSPDESDAPIEWVESVGVAEIDGRIAARTLTARWDLPQRDVSMMDGYAVRSLDVAHARACGNAIVLTVRGESAAGHPSEAALEPGQAARISTGAVLPAGADAVIAQEDTQREGDRLVVDDASLGTLQPGTFVRHRGREVARGWTLVEPGDRLGPGDIALLAGCGHAEVPVIRRPSVAILSTGDELVDVGTDPAPDQVVSSNGLVLAALVRRAGAVPRLLPDVGDDRARLRASLEQGLQADVLITSGGISVGDHDLVDETLRELGATPQFRGVALRPGKPTTYFTTETCSVFALPGNPASSLVAFTLLVHPALRRRAGVRGDPRLPRLRVVLDGPARGAGNRAHYVRARLDPRTTRSDGIRVATPLTTQQSGDLRSIAHVDVLVVVPPGVAELPSGSPCDAVVLEPAAHERAPSRAPSLPDAPSRVPAR